MSSQKCYSMTNSLGKQNLFSDSNKSNANESKLKQNVIYRRKYTLRPTVKLDDMLSNKSLQLNASRNNAKNSSNNQRRDHSSQPIIKAKQTFVEKNLYSNESTDAIKPVIRLKPRAMNSHKSKAQDMFESKSPDMRRRTARSASVPAIQRYFKRNSNESDDKQSSDDCRLVMNQIRRRVSQIIDSNLLSEIQSRHQSSDSQSSSKISEKMKSQTTTPETSVFKTVAADRRPKSNDSGFGEKHLFTFKANHSKENKTKRFELKSDEYKRSSEQINYKPFDRKQENKQNFDQISSEEANEDKSELSLRVKDKYYENLRNNSYALIHNLNNYQIDV